MSLIKRNVKKLGSLCDLSSNAQLTPSGIYLSEEKTLFWSHIIT